MILSMIWRTINTSCTKREAEPWLLVGHLPPNLISVYSMAGIYRLRMQIEEGFRDGKSEPLGLGLLEQGVSTVLKSYY